MTYAPNQPQDLPPPLTATAQIKTNFSQFQAVFSVNHSALNTSNQGKHEKVIFEQQSADPGVTSNYVAMYSKSVTNAAGTQPQLFIQPPQFLPNQQPNLPEQLTYHTVNTSGPQFQTFLPGGYVMHFGEVTSLPVTITLSPSCTKIASVVAMASSLTTGLTPAAMNVTVSGIGASSFTIQSQTTGINPPSFKVSWTAIGIQ